MEKKAPERKVQLRDGDVFYVYDKRINKCIKEGCGGIVKYGLTLKVNMPNGDTLNTYECNKCHMKYTAYPNYVRLTETKWLTIYNQDEVNARDRKRAADAAKQASREKKKAHARRHAAQSQNRVKTTDKKKEHRPYQNSKHGNGMKNKLRSKYAKSHGHGKGSDQ
ncbi:MAG: hypothetical protein K2I96_04380 [Lachnospiraceae bacterium]|nr:hypothetical protein [Lachnospiraceae bacterium]